MSDNKSDSTHTSLEEHLSILRYGIEADRFRLDQTKARCENSFFAKHFPAFLAGAVALAGTLVSGTNIWVSYTTNKNTADIAAKKDLREFVATHRAELFGIDRKAAEQLRRALEITFPPDLVADVLARIAPQAPAETRDIFNTAPKEGPVIRGKIQTWGGPNDAGISASEGLALVREVHLPALKDYFLASPSGTTGLARQLNPATFYVSARWNYSRWTAEFLRTHKVTVTNPKTGQKAEAQPVDWGPGSWTGRAFDVSPGLAKHLGLQTDDEAILTIPEA